MLGYHRDPKATEAKFTDGWLRTGDLASRSEFVTEFWRSRDFHPETPVNEFREDEPGALDDRGSRSTDAVAGKQEGVGGGSESRDGD